MICSLMFEIETIFNYFVDVIQAFLVTIQSNKNPSKGEKLRPRYFKRLLRYAVACTILDYILSGTTMHIAQVIQKNKVYDAKIQCDLFSVCWFPIPFKHCIPLSSLHHTEITKIFI